MLATIRPDDWNTLVFFHLLAAVALMGSLVLVTAWSLASRNGAPPLLLTARRFVLLVLAILGWPGLIATVVLGHALVGKEDAKGTWLDVGIPLAEIGGLVGLVVLTVVAVIGFRRARAGVDWRPAATVPAALAPALLVVFGAVIFLMASKL